MIKDCTSQMLIFIWRMQIVERTMENLFDSGIVPKSKVTSSRQKAHFRFYTSKIKVDSYFYLNGGVAFQMVIDNLKGTPNLTGLVMDELDIRLTKQVEMDNSHNWTRMAEIEAGLEDGLKGDTFPLNTSGNYMHNNGPSPGGGGGSPCQETQFPPACVRSSICHL